MRCGVGPAQAYHRHNRIGVGKCTPSPKSFPYLYVDLRLDQGCHVVEDEELGAAGLFALNTASLIGLDPAAKAIETSADLENAFIGAFDPFDWTKMLHT